jgi:hypothetical protein
MKIFKIAKEKLESSDQDDKIELVVDPVLRCE